MVNGSIGRFYFIPDLKIVDYHGLADSTVARTPVTTGNDHRFIAHDRAPSPEYLKQRGVNIEIFPPASSADAALNVADYAVKFGPDLWMPLQYFQRAVGNSPFRRPRTESQKDFLDQRACPQPLSCRRLHLCWRAHSRTFRARL